MNVISQKGIWTWGHVIYDMRGFFGNMKKLGLDRITIWNDFAPLNAKSILEEAHKCGVKVIWGFSWGWVTDCGTNIKDISDESIRAIRENVLKVFDEQYKDISDDGIYFQSFTEMQNDKVNGISIADSVVKLVNSTAAALLKRYPHLQINFGLHAMSVKNDLHSIAQTDKHVRIVWEDLGAFPFSYEATQTDGFEETIELTKKILRLRGDDEKCGLIVKAMTQLDWTKFEYAKGPLVIGESSREFIEGCQPEKDIIWAKQSEGWKKNIEYAKRAFETIGEYGKDVVVEALIEDGLFENEIKEPAVIFADLCRNT